MKKVLALCSLLAPAALFAAEDVVTPAVSS